MVKVEEVVLETGEIAVGLRVQVNPAGEEQVSEIWPLSPPTALALIIKLVEFPGATVVLWAERIREKSGLPTVAAGRTLANTAVVLPPGGKLGWLLPPAVR